jgi:DNA-binding transcriptional MerR regulator
LISVEKALPPIPAKRYFTIGEVSELCGVKPYVLRYWEQEFAQLKPMKRRGNRRYYQHHEVLLIRRIRELLYEQGFTISGARNRLAETGGRGAASAARDAEPTFVDPADAEPFEREMLEAAATAPTAAVTSVKVQGTPSIAAVREELLSIRHLLMP